MYRQKTSELVAAGPNMVTFRKSNGDISNILAVGDWRGVTESPDFPDYVYVGDQHLRYIRELDTVSGSILRNWKISFDNPNSGLVSVTFVPDPNNPQGGNFLGWN